jgi:hypothetical protein
MHNRSDKGVAEPTSARARRLSTSAFILLVAVLSARGAFADGRDDAKTAAAKRPADGISVCGDPCGGPNL